MGPGDIIWALSISQTNSFMPRTVVSLSDEDKSWLDHKAQTEGVPMTELVRRAVREYRERYGHGGPRHFGELLDRTQGCWRRGDGMRYQDLLRDEWERRR